MINNTYGAKDFSIESVFFLWDFAVALELEPQEKPREKKTPSIEKQKIDKQTNKTEYSISKVLIHSHMAKR